MKRSDFIKTSAGLGAIALIPYASYGKEFSNHEAFKAAKIVRNKTGRELNVLGDKMTFKLTGKDTDGQYSLIEQNNEPGVGIPMHVHDNEDELFKVINGQLEVQIADNQYILGPGDLAFCPRGVPHSWKVTGDQDAKIDLSFFPAGLEDMFEELATLAQGPPDLGIIAGITGKYGVKFV